MDSELFLGAYWGMRPESIEHCADRLEGFFAELRASDSALSTWFELGKTRKDAFRNRADVLSREYLLKVLHEGRNRTDIGQEIIKELGFSIYLWNGASQSNAASIHVHCGAYSEYGGSNCVNMDFPKEFGAFQQPDRMARILSVVAKSWEPDWAGVMSREAMDTRDFDARTPFVDWMLYLNRQLLPHVLQLPAPAVIQQVDGIGSIIVVQDEAPEPQNPEHLENVKRVESVLGRSMRRD